MSSSPLFQPLTLPNGAVLRNRLAKAAMEENMAAKGQLPGPALFRLYARWAKGGAGLLLTGNVMVDARAMTGPSGVVLDAHQPLEPFRTWAAAMRSAGGHAWMQINHPGRQVYADMGQEALAPSPVGLDIGRYSKLFPVPREMTEADIAAMIERFVVTSVRAEEAGFTGVEIHAAHGYLISQFLSPLTNRRTDRWGGSLENRARLLLAVVKAVRARIAPGFAVGVKLNSADFQKGGFDLTDAARVVGWLGELAVDLVELSGGSMESPAMAGAPTDSTLAREAYFVEFAREIAVSAKMPIMATGGIRRRAIAEAAVTAQANRAPVDLVGMGRALAFAPDLPARWSAGDDVAVDLPPVNWTNQPMARLAEMAVVKVQLKRLGARRKPKPDVSPFLALAAQQLGKGGRTRTYRRWVAGRPSAAIA